jgi:hypothetical protein
MRRDELVTFFRRHGDETLAAALTALVLIEAGLTDAQEWQRLAKVALAVGLGLTAARRSRDPLPLLGLILVTSIATLAVPTLTGPTSGVFLFFLLAVYSAAAHTSGRRQSPGGSSSGLPAPRQRRLRRHWTR